MSTITIGTASIAAIFAKNTVKGFVGQPILAAAGFKPALGRDDTYSGPPGKAAAGKIACPTSLNSSQLPA